MPKRPLKPCNKTGCKKLTTSTYCTDHQKSDRKYYEQFRESASERGYDSIWTKLRKMYIREHPVCEVDGCMKPAEEVHHRKSIEDRPDLRLDKNNLMSMCLYHHNQTKHKAKELKK